MVNRKRIVVGITGASGAIYARRLVECLCAAEVDVHLVVTPHGRQLLADELDIPEVSAESLLGHASDRLILHAYRDVGALIASGGFLTGGMIVCPCSSNTLAAIAAGLADNLLDRAAAVTLKEMRRLVLVPREMPMSRIELSNALRLSEAGAVICPACPGFYMRPAGIDDLVDFVVGKLLDLVGVSHALNTRWGEARSDVPATSG
ncbi:MAG: UbiX family flavin prenyltransferase [Planctomycetes bacterium]|nr:UbiX family flavin prenyltransferase [Planctomycetota bacterium]